MSSALILHMYLWNMGLCILQPSLMSIADILWAGIFPTPGCRKQPASTQKGNRRIMGSPSSLIQTRDHNSHVPVGLSTFKEQGITKSMDGR